MWETIVFWCNWSIHVSKTKTIQALLFWLHCYIWGIWTSKMVANIYNVHAISTTYQVVKYNLWLKQHVEWLHSSSLNKTTNWIPLNVSSLISCTPSLSIILCSLGGITNFTTQTTLKKHYTTWEYFSKT